MSNLENTLTEGSGKDWEDGQTRYQIGYGSNYLNGKRVTLNDKLDGVTKVHRNEHENDT